MQVPEHWRCPAKQWWGQSFHGNFFSMAWSGDNTNFIDWNFVMMMQNLRQSSGRQEWFPWWRRKRFYFWSLPVWFFQRRFQECRGNSGIMISEELTTCARLLLTLLCAGRWRHRLGNAGLCWYLLMKSAVSVLRTPQCMVSTLLDAVYESRSPAPAADNGYGWF